MRVVAVNPSQPRADRLEGALQTLVDGGIVALPTETFYGLAVDCMDAGALAAVNRLKGKPGASPILLLLSDTSQVAQVAGRLPPSFSELAELFWPGPLTLVVPASPAIPQEISAGRGTVAVRVPGLGLPRRLAAALGRPIAGVSANRHGEPPSRTAAEVASAFPDGVRLILDGGPTPGGAPSTVLDISGPRPVVLREGLLPSSALRSFVPDLSGAPL